MRLMPALLAACLAGPALADDLDDRATAIFSAAYQEACSGAFLEDGRLIEPPQRFAMTSPSSYGGDPAPMVLWLFRCNIGAYNVQSVALAYSEMNGVIPLHFATPDLNIVLEDPEDYESAVKEVQIMGWSATPFLVNAEVDAAAGELRQVGYWRGIGDASDMAVWRLADEAFRLIRYEVDASYDGAVNPEVLVTFP